MLVVDRRSTALALRADRFVALLARLAPRCLRWTPAQALTHACAVARGRCQALPRTPQRSEPAVEVAVHPAREKPLTRRAWWGRRNGCTPSHHLPGPRRAFAPRRRRGRSGAVALAFY